MSCNGCRVLRKGCSESCILRQCLKWIENPDAQGHATVFVAKFFGRAGMMALISSVTESQGPALFQSLLYEACGRTINPVFGAVGLLCSGNWQLCQEAVETVMKGGLLCPTASAGTGRPHNGASSGPKLRLGRGYISAPVVRCRGSAETAHRQQQPTSADNSTHLENQNLKRKDTTTMRDCKSASSLGGRRIRRRPSSDLHAEEAENPEGLKDVVERSACDDEVGLDLTLGSPAAVPIHEQKGQLTRRTGSPCYSGSEADSDTTELSISPWSSIQSTRPTATSATTSAAGTASYRRDLLDLLR